MLIHIPTPRERKKNFSWAWSGNNLDPQIEAAEMQQSFFVSGFRFTESTLERLGIRIPLYSQRERIRKAFDKANAEIVREFVV